MLVSIIGAKAGDTLSAAILNQDDPELVESGVPAYILLIDGLISQSPDSVGLLSAGAQLFALYGSRFAPPERAVTLTAKARRYGERAHLLVARARVQVERHRLRRARRSSSRPSARRNVDALYSYAVSWLSNLDATSEDWTAVAELPWVEAVLERALALDETYESGAIARLSRDSELVAPAGARRQARASPASTSSARSSSRAARISRSR